MLRYFLNGTFSGTGSIVSIVFVVIVLVFTFFSSCEVVLGEETVTASAMLVAPVEVSYELIDEVSLHDYDELSLGERGRGFKSLFTISGSYINEEYGIYDIYVNKSNTDNFVLIRYSEICYIVVNEKTAADTELLMENLSARVG